MLSNKTNSNKKNDNQIWKIKNGRAVKLKRNTNFIDYSKKNSNRKDMYQMLRKKKIWNG